VAKRLRIRNDALNEALPHEVCERLEAGLIYFVFLFMQSNWITELELKNFAIILVPFYGSSPINIYAEKALAKKSSVTATYQHGVGFNAPVSR